jgi:arabinofuranosyltransferase
MPGLSLQRLPPFARFVPLGAAAVLLLLHSLRYNFVTDDAYISFVFSRNFAEHGQLTFNLGDRVEGYTNFLWTLVLGLLMIVGINPEIASRVLGFACALGTFWFSFRIMECAIGRPTWWAGLPAVLLSLSSGFACWTSGGLETQLFTMLVVGAWSEYLNAAVVDSASKARKAWMWMGVMLALSAMTRPEGLLITALIAIHHLISQLHRVYLSRSVPESVVTARWKRVIGPAQLWGAAAMLTMWLPWFAWRWWYYGWPFPNTYYVKAHGPWTSADAASKMWDNGGYYIGVWLANNKLAYVAPLIVCAVIVGGRQGGARRLLATLCVMVSAVYLIYTASVGGDFMGLHRFIMPLFVIVALLVALGAFDVITWCQRQMPKWSSLVGVALVAGILVGYGWQQFALTSRSLRWGNFSNDRGILDTPRFLITYTEDRAAIGRAMEPCFVATDFSIVGGAGAQPYFGRMRAIDVFGLVSERIAHEEPRSNPRPGHTKWASDRLLQSYDPTFVFSCYAIHASPVAPALGCAGSWLSRGYQIVTMHVPGMKQQGEYYSFVVKKDRQFSCPGLFSAATNR